MDNFIKFNPEPNTTLPSTPKLLTTDKLSLDIDYSNMINKDRLVPLRTLDVVQDIDTLDHNTKISMNAVNKVFSHINEADWAAIEDTIYLNACPNHRPHPENEWQNRDTRHGSDASGQPVTLNPTLNLTMIMITTNKESIHPNPTLKYPDGH